MSTEKVYAVSVSPFERKLQFRGKESIKFIAAPAICASDYKHVNVVWEIEIETNKDMEKENEEPKIEKVGNYSPSGHSAASVVSPEGISPTVMHNNDTITAVVEPLNTDKDGLCRTIKAQYYKNSGRNLIEQGSYGCTGAIEIEQPVYNNKRLNTLIESGKIDSEKITYLDAYNQSTSEEIASTISARVDDGNHLLSIPEEQPPLKVPQATSKGYIECPVGGVFDGSYPNSKLRRGKVQEGGKVTPAITSAGEPLNVYEGVHKCNYRIRKLTPRECFRLQGVNDSDIDKIQAAGISKSQQYKLAGNSIVVDVLYHLFRKMFIETECESQQLTLF